MYNILSMNSKFLTKLLNESFRAQILTKNAKIINDTKLQLNQYATYVVDKHAKDQNLKLKNSREFFYGYDPIDILAYCSVDGSVKKLCFEFKTVNHFLHENNRLVAVDVVKCILSEIVRENKKDILSFDIDKIDADAKQLEEKYKKEIENLKKQKENKELKND